MKNLKDYISEGQNFLVNRKLKNRQQQEYHPKTKEELKEIIINLLKQGKTDLNCIDVSEIIYMEYIFEDIYCNETDIIIGDIDISEWDVSNVKSMNFMFRYCIEFNSDLSKWDVSNVETMDNMFYGCEKFNSNLSKWNVSKVTDMTGMFTDCELLNCDLSRWNVSKVKYMDYMFSECKALNKNNLIPKWYTGEV